MPCYGNDNHNTQLLAELMNAKNQGTDAATMAALFSKNNQNAWDNPFIWLIWLAWMGNGGLFGNRTDVAQNADLSRQVSALQDTVNTNHNNDLAMQAINGNSAAIAELAQTLNCDYNSMMMAVNNVKSSIDSVAGQIGYSTESIKNAITLGDANIMSKMQDCCCQQKQLIIEQGYQNQLATERQTNTLQAGITDTRQAVVNGFANIGYTMAQQTCELKTNQNENTQRIIDTLNAHWQNETSLALQDEKFKNSQLQQNQYLASLIQKNCGCQC